MNRLPPFIVSLFFSALINAQPIVKVTVSADTIQIGEMVEVMYTIENGDGKFNMPDMDNLPLISGPNSSSSYIYQNGKASSNQSYSFTLLGMEEGKLVVPQTTYQSNGEKQIIHAVEIVVSTTHQPSSSSSNSATSPGSKATREKKKI